MTIRTWLSKTLVFSLLVGTSLDVSPSAEQKGEDVDEEVVEPLSLEQRLDREDETPNGRPEKYAVLISGTVEKRDTFDISHAYQVLLENGYNRKNVYIFDGDGKKTLLYPVDAAATERALSIMFYSFTTRLEKQDSLFVYLTGHGNTTNRHNPQKMEIALPGENVEGQQFVASIEWIHASPIIVLADICYGGALAQFVSRKDILLISSSQAYETAEGDVGGTFSGLFFEAYRSYDEADKNNDGVVSFNEAFDYARENHGPIQSRRHTPLFFGRPDPEVLSLSFPFFSRE